MCAGVYTTGECSGCDACVQVCTLHVIVAGVTCVCVGVYTTGECSGCDVCVCRCVHYR